jgi:hypothetical protein
MRLLVCGGRDFRDRAAFENAMCEVVAAHGYLTAIIHGGAPGADKMADDWAARNGVATHIFYADWKKYGRAAGPIRNQRMIDEGKPDLALAMPGGRGTADMVRRLEAAGVPVLRSVDGRDKE